MLSRLLRVEEVAEKLNLPRSTVYLLIKRGDLPGAMRFGRAWRVSEDMLALHINQRVNKNER